MRDVVIERLEQLGASRCDLAHYGGVDGAALILFRFLSGEAQTSYRRVAQILELCGVGLVILDDNPKWENWPE